MSTEADPMILPLSNREIEYVITWKEEAFWPDAARIINKLKRALDSGEALQLSRLQVQIVQGWAEEQVGGPYGSMTLNTEERGIAQKLQSALGGGL
jgi:hypothetical protein